MTLNYIELRMILVLVGSKEEAVSNEEPEEVGNEVVSNEEQNEEVKDLLMSKSPAN